MKAVMLAGGVPEKKYQHRYLLRTVLRTSISPAGIPDLNKCVTGYTLHTAYPVLTR